MPGAVPGGMLRSGAARALLVGGLAVALLAWLVLDVPEGRPNGRAGFSPGGQFPFLDGAARREDLDAMRRSGAGWLRLDLPWSAMEPEQGRFVWSRVDAAVADAREAGLKVLALPAYTPAWARPPDTGDKHPPTDPADFAAFVAAAAERYPAGLVAAWEIWNEPNIDNFWSTGADPAGYVDLLRAAVAALREVRPDAFVVSAGLAPSTDGENDLSPVTFTEQMYAQGLAGLVDALAAHPYSFPLMPGSAAPQNSFADLQELRRVMVANGESDKKIWVTEYGAPTGDAPDAVSEEEQAVILARGYRLARKEPWIGPVFFYSLRDAGPDRSYREDNFGVLREDGSPKRAWFVVRNLLSDDADTDPPAG